jgi:hypothetical protein
VKEKIQKMKRQLMELQKIFARHTKNQVNIQNTEGADVTHYQENK